MGNPETADRKNAHKNAHGLPFDGPFLTLTMAKRFLKTCLAAKGTNCLAANAPNHLGDCVMALVQPAISNAVALCQTDALLRIGRFIFSLWHETKRDAVRPYRRELHYMRGPGPAWHAKHGAKLPN